ncbi:MAG: S41 family peptidase [Dysgonamonadaceae bacterium]|jgi:carboxyl-terminal processing protease|nr:S41 family peptidase [Dysgonamonadaceae bacterium]
MKNVFLSILLFIGLGSCSYGQGTAAWNIGGDPAARKLSMTLSAIENYYVDTINKNKMADEAIVFLLQKLDPHSGYLTPEEVKEMNEPLQGNFDGIGIQFNMLTDTLYVVQVISGGPSEKVGLMAGDRILMVNDTLIAGVGMKNTDIMSRLRGPKGTTVHIQVKRGSELIPFTIVRGKIPMYSLDASYMLDKETGYIALNRFAETTYGEFTKALHELQGKGMKNLILDLQTNGGGYLNSAIQIANEFLKRGNLIVYTEGIHQKREDAYASMKGSFEDGKLIVLINESSASASEIVTGALQDWDRAVIVGRRSFGKGLVQRPLPLPDGSMLKLTTARYYTPAGRSIQKPYEQGNSDAYNMDLINRYNRGEMGSADSIHFPDSLKYRTLVNKRIVYGGGGIMPDYFVPLDTTYATDIHRALVASGTLNKYVMSYIDNNRAALKARYPDFNTFKSNFTVNSEMLKGLLRLYDSDSKNAKTNRTEEDLFLPEDILVIDRKNLDDFQKSAPLIQLQIKALIVRDLWDMNEYYQIINQENSVLKKAIEIINDTKQYHKLLGK